MISPTDGPGIGYCRMNSLKPSVKVRYEAGAPLSLLVTAINCTRKTSESGSPPPLLFEEEEEEEEDAELDAPLEAPLAAPLAAPALQRNDK